MTSRFPGFDALEGRSALVIELTERRRSRDLSQTDVAAAMGTSQSAVARIESGADVRLSTLGRYVEAVGASVVFSLADR